MGNNIFEGEPGLKLAICLTEIDGFKVIDNQRIIRLLRDLESRPEFKDVRDPMRAKMAWLHRNDLSPNLLTTTSLLGDQDVTN